VASTSARTFDARSPAPAGDGALSGDGPVALAPPALAAMSGGAVAAWVEDDCVRYAVYR
jgi:hypothetical protein